MEGRLGLHRHRHLSLAIEERDQARGVADQLYAELKTTNEPKDKLGVFAEQMYWNSHGVPPTKPQAA